MGYHHTTPSSSSMAQRQKLLISPLVTIVGLALVSLIVILIMLKPTGHDRNWHRATLDDHHEQADRHATLADTIDERPTVRRIEQVEAHRDVVGSNAQQQQIGVGGDDEKMKLAEPEAIHLPAKQPVTQRDANGRPIFRPLVKDKDYFSDYDVSAVKLDPAPEPEAGKPHYFNYIDPATNNEYAMQYLSNSPRVLAVQDFLTYEECDMLIDLATKKLFRSQVAPTIGSKDSAVNDVRTSSQAWLPAASAEVKPIVDRILKLTGMPPGSNEELQILRYQKGQKYDAHNDYFDPKMYGAQSSNRAVTAYLYLSDVEEGGETQFPRADGKGPTFDFKSCNRGLRVHPRKGQLAIFYDMKPDGQLDPYSLHGSCPVVSGVKWGGTLWLRVPTGGH